VDIWDAVLPVIAENSRVSQCLVDAGSSTPDAVLRTRAALADAKQQRAEAVRVRDAARGAFNLLLDQPDETPMPTAPGEASMTGKSLFDAPSISLDLALQSSARREERQMASAAASGAHAQQRAATAGFVPSVGVAADYGIQGDRYHFDRNHDVATASVVVSWNLFSGGQDMARREAADAAQRSAELQAAEIDRQIALDVRTAWDAVRVAREALAAADERVNAASAAFHLIDRRYTEGLTSYLEWSDARAQLTSAQLNQVQTGFLLAARGIDLERAAALRNIPIN
jgi:outer membrane protein TolC